MHTFCVERSGVGDGVLAHLAGLGSLKVLRINVSQSFTGRGLEKLSCLPVLEDAAFYWTAFADEGARVPAKFPRLREVHLERTVITDAGLAKLAAAAGLAKLDLKSTNVSDQAVAALQRALPDCVIVR